MTVDILLATYNGETFLTEQLESLLAQSVTDWRLLIRDDGSTDNTMQILQAYRAREPLRIHILDNLHQRLGASGNFSALLHASSAGYVMCCDQDDVWMQDKIARTLGAMQALEALHGSHCPLLVHTDAVIVGEAQQQISLPFARHHHSFTRQLVQNTVQGCSLMANRALVQRAVPIPSAARMHDMWLGITAAAFGHITYLHEPTFYYRQHSANAVCARKKSPGDIKKSMRANALQAQAFHARHADTLSKRQSAAALALANLFAHSWPKRAQMLVQHRLLRRPLWQNLLVLMCV